LKNVNLAKVRSTAAMLATAALLALPSTAMGKDDPRVIVAVVPYGTTVEQIAAVPELAPGIISAGLSSVPPAQTFLDVSQGNRTNESLYDRDLPPLYVEDGRVPPDLWARTLKRADSAPADIVPGLLASTIAEAAIPVATSGGSDLASLIAVNRHGRVHVVRGEACRLGCEKGFSLIRARVGELPRIVRGLDENDLLIAIASGLRAEQTLLPVGIAGKGFHGNLTSASTRTEGIVTTTDIAPTVLERLGLDVPDEVNGTEITSSDERNPAEVADLQARLDNRPSRDLVVLLPLGAWLALAGLAALLWRRRGAATALRLLGLACVWAPALLLAAAALDASEPASALLVGFGAPALALFTDRLLPGCRGFALACAVTVGAHAVDVVAGSPLTKLSVLGPNPGGGVRFFGIGNELEAVLTTLVVIGTGAWLQTRPALSRRTGAAWFAATALLAAAAFAPGRFGADVGAAIVLGVGGATAAVLALGLERRRAILVVAGAGVGGLAALVAVDLVLGGAHLSRTVLGAGGTGDLADVFDRRLTLMTRTFLHPVYPQLLALTVLALVAGFVRRRQVLSWFGDGWAARSGFLGALAGILVGTLANDSGSVLLVIGTIYLAVSAGFFWAVRGR
jgi:hypothetical protein